MAAIGVVLGATTSAANAGGVSGVVYDSATGKPVRGIALQLYYDADDVEPGRLVPGLRLGPGQQGQVTGSNGSYRFDVEPGRKYRLVPLVGQSSYAFPSAKVPVTTGFAPTGDIQSSSSAPSAGARRTHYLRFEIATANDRVNNNHLPVDALKSLVTISKRADRTTASTGDIIHYTITVTNRSSRDLTAAANKSVFVVDHPARGFSFVAGQARARISSGTRSIILRPPLLRAERSRTRSRREIRFRTGASRGFDLPAGAKLVLHYQVVVGSDTRPGKSVNLARAVDSAGVALSGEARATVRIAADDTQRGLVLGRVFCDLDRDRRKDAREPGVYGARIYLDTGSYAITDRAGLYHFSRVVAGTRLVKIDAASLAGSALLGTPTRLLRMTRGLTERADFPVDCKRVQVTSRHPGASVALEHPIKRRTRTPPAAPKTRRVRVAVDAVSLRVSVDGEAIATAITDIALRANPGMLASPRNLVAPPKTGWTGNDNPGWTTSWRAPPGIQAKSWRLTIKRLDGALVRRLEGQGNPPARIRWDGLSATGRPASANTMYIAQLRVVGDRRRVVAESARRPFGIAYGLAKPASTRTVVRGVLFAGRLAAPRPTKRLREAIARLVPTIGPNDSVIIESHFDGTGAKLPALARTQREAKLVLGLLVTAGVAASNLTARGRGSLEPLEPGRSRAARAANRRLVIEVRRPNAAPSKSIPTTNPGSAEVNVAGKLQPLDAASRVAVLLPPPDRPLRIEVRAVDGRSTRIAVPFGKAAADPAPPSKASLTISGDLNTGMVRVGTRQLPAALLRMDARVSQPRDGVVRTRGRGAKRRLRSNVVIALGIPSALDVTAWELRVRGIGGANVLRRSGTGVPPASVTWDGRDEQGRLALTSGNRYAVAVRVTTRDGSVGQSPLRTFWVDRHGGRISAVRGMFFTRSGRTTGLLRNHLSALVYRLRGRTSVRHRLALAIRRRGASSVERRLSLAARTASFRRYLARLGMKPGRYELRVTEVAGRTDSLIVTRPVATPKPKPGVAVNGAAVAVEAGKFARSVQANPGAAMVIDVVLPSGHRAIFAVVVPKPRTPTPQPGSPPTPQPGSPSTQPGSTPRPQPGSSPNTAKPLKPNPSPLDPDVGPKDSSGFELDVDAFVPETPVHATNLRVHLPPPNVALQSRTLPIIGRTHPTNRIDVTTSSGTRRISVGKDGHFAAQIRLPVGKTKLVIRSKDRAGNRVTIPWPVNVAKQRVFVMGLAETVVASSYTARGWFSDTAYLDGMVEDSTVALGPVLLHGRAAAYLKARVPGGRVAEELAITAHIDTAKSRNTGAFFEQVFASGNGADRGFPTHGDSAEEVRDVNTRGKLYARVEAGKSSAVIGSINTAIQSGRLVRYDRAVDGALVHIDRDVNDRNVQVRAFGTVEAGRLSRDVNVYRATGGSLYYLRHGRVLEGSERVRVIVRDRDTGLTISDRVLERNRDYTVDYVGGRVRLTAPITSTASSSWVIDNFDAANTPLNGNPVYIEARYEHEDTNAAGNRAAGASVRANVHDRVTVGAGLVGEGRGDAPSYALWGADAVWTIGKTSRAAIELAGSRSNNAFNHISQDGGLTFQNLNRTAESSMDSRSGHQLAVRLGFQIDLEEIAALRKHAPRTKVKGWVQWAERGFYSDSALLDQGRTRLGVMVEHRLRNRDRLRVRHLAEVARLPRVGPTPADVPTGDPLSMDERAATITSAQWSRLRGRWLHRAEVGLHRLSSTAPLADGSAALDTNRVGIGARSSYAYSKRLRLRAGQQIVVGIGGADPILDPVVPFDSTRRTSEPLAGVTTNVGADLRLTTDLKVGLDWYQRWNGDNAAQIGLESALSPNGSMYLRERVQTNHGRASSYTVIGAEERVRGGQGRTYGEYQIDNGMLGHRNRAVLGLGHRWTLRRGVAVAMGFEHQQIFGGFLPDGTPVGRNQRNVAYAAADLLRHRDLRAGAQVELRVDNGFSSVGVPDLITEDRRRTANPGDFPDHGGTAPGSPLVLPPGDKIQVVAGLGASWKATPPVTLIGRVRVAHTEVDAVDGAEYTAARYWEITAGAAYRPPTTDWLNVLVRYSYLRDQRPVTSSAAGLDSDAHVLAVVPLVDLPWKLRATGKLAYKRTSATSRIALDALDMSADAVLWLLRLGHQFYGRWDASAEVRGLRLGKPGGSENKIGSLLELGYNLKRWLRLGAGYNFSRFSDNELGDLTRDGHGAFVRVTGQY